MLKKRHEIEIKSMTEFEETLACSIKCLYVKKNNKVKSITRFFSGKMLMHAKIYLKSFTYDLIETLDFRNKILKKNYDKYMI